MARSFSQYTSHQQIYTIGAPIPVDGKAETWGSSCITDPQVVYYELKVISDLLKPQFFPQNPEIGLKQAYLITALGDYCNQMKKQGKVKDCDSPFDPDRVRDNVLGGMYQVDDCGRNNVNNGVTGGLFCPASYTAVEASRFQSPESKCGAVQFYCVERSKLEKGSFGGIYQINDNGRGKYSNRECGSSYCCPNNKKPYVFQRVYHPEERVGSNTYICLGSFVPGKSQIGGFYQMIDTGKAVDNIFNPYTGGPSCPLGYKAIQIGRIKVPEEDRNGANSFICILS